MASQPSPTRASPEFSALNQEIARWFHGLPRETVSFEQTGSGNSGESLRVINDPPLEYGCASVEDFHLMVPETGEEVFVCRLLDDQGNTAKITFDVFFVINTPVLPKPYKVQVGLTVFPDGRRKLVDPKEALSHLNELSRFLESSVFLDYALGRCREFHSKRSRTEGAT